MSDSEYVLLIGNYQHLLRGEKEQVDSRLAERGYSEAAMKAVETKVKVDTGSVVSMGIKFKRHLSQFRYPLMSYVLTLFEGYERGVLPYQGSLADQPFKIIEIFNLLTHLKLEQEGRRLREQEKQRKNVRL